MNAIFSLPTLSHRKTFRYAILLSGIGLLIACDRSDNSRPPPASSAASSCDLNHASCEVPTNWGTATVTLSPKPVPVLQPITVELHLASPAPVEVQASLNGVDMDMGPNITRLQRAGANLWHGQMTVPICLTGTMRWQLSIDLRDGARNESVAFGFTAPIGHGQAN